MWPGLLPGLHCQGPEVHPKGMASGALGTAGGSCLVWSHCQEHAKHVEMQQTWLVQRGMMLCHHCEQCLSHIYHTISHDRHVVVFVHSRQEPPCSMLQCWQELLSSIAMLQIQM